MQTKKLSEITAIGIDFRLIITLVPVSLISLLYCKLLQSNGIINRPSNRFNG